MVKSWSDRQNKRRDSRHVTSDWAEAPIEATILNQHLENSDREDNHQNNNGTISPSSPSSVPEMDLSAIRAHLDASLRCSSDVGSDDLGDHQSDHNDSMGSLDNNLAGTQVNGGNRDAPPASMRGSIKLNKLMSFGQDRRPSKSIVQWDDNDGVPYVDNVCDDTVAPSSSASRTSKSDYTTSTGSNIWTKLMGGGAAEGLWDDLNGKGFDVEGGVDDDNMDGAPFDNSCGANTKRCGLAWWYETKHFFRTMGKHPHIPLLSLLVFGVLCGVGIVAINSQRDQYIDKQKGTAEFVAAETAEWFSQQFRRAMLPLYSIQQGVVHSGYFDDLPNKIGPYPNRVIPETEETPFTKRDVSGICDNPDVVQKWKDIVQPINADNDLDGIVQGYRLFPGNVACLTEPHEQVNVPSDTPDKFDGMFEGEALLASDNVMGLDTGHTAFPLWKMITTDLFVERNFNIFGPFPMPPMTELICGHIAIWNKPDPNDPTKNVLDVHGTEVENAWGFVVNFLDWKKLKDKSNIYQRFAGCNLEFRLSRKSGSTVGLDLEVLAESEGINTIADEDTVSVETETMHGIWVNTVGRKIGWNPPWYNAAVAGVVLVSFLLCVLTASTLVERQLHRNLLYKVMPRKAIAKLHRGQTVLEKFNLVTIFFSDIVGFTSMSGTMRPIQVMKMLNELYTELDKIAEKHKVYKVETIGDAYMVVGGAPDRCRAPLAAERVALFAIDVTNFVKDFRTKDGDQIFIRAGLASGPTVAGVVGQAMPRYCFFGDTVNFASRMESTSKKMKIQCAEVTYRLLMDAPNMNFQLSKRMEGGIAGIEVKGKGHQVTYWIERARKRIPGERKAPVDVPETRRHYIDVTGKIEEVVEEEEEEHIPQDEETAPTKAAGESDLSGSDKSPNGPDKEDDAYDDFLQMLEGGDEQAPNKED